MGGHFLPGEALEIMGFLPAPPWGGGVGRGPSGWWGCLVTALVRGSFYEPGKPRVGWVALACCRGRTHVPGSGPHSALCSRVTWGSISFSEPGLCHLWNGVMTLTSRVVVRVNLRRAGTLVLAWEQGRAEAGGPPDPQCPHLWAGERSVLLWCWGGLRLPLSALRQPVMG